MTTPESETSRRAPALAPDIWLLAVSLAAGLGTARLTDAPGAAHVVGPIVATVVAGHAAASLARRLRVTGGVVLASGVVAVALATVWGQLLGATRHGFPTPGTWRALVARFEAAGTIIGSHPTPVPATADIVLCIATGAGLVAVLGRSLWAWQEGRGARPLLALVPSFGLFCYTSLLSSQVDRVPGTVAYLAGALVFVMVADSSTRRARSVPGRFGAGLRGALPAAMGAALAVVVPLGASTALATMRVNALPFAPAGGSNGVGLGLGTNGFGPGAGGSGGPGFTGVRTIDLVDNLQAILVNRTKEVMFSARSPVPSYWQVAVLTKFDGTAWQPDATTQAAAQSIAILPPDKPVPGLPALPEPPAQKTFTAAITIGDLQSTLLPLPPTTVSVNADAAVVPGFGVVQAIEAPPGLSYSAVARVPVKPPTNTNSADVAASELAPYLQLPTLPAPVVALAHQIVAGANGPAAQAAALTRWFDNGRFRYTVSPPPPTGPSPLSSFLFTTRAGFCQQFAATYAVLARIDGLPTRVAVGFTTGTSRGHGQYRITGEDAHVWPEVYLGPKAGWTSYEPTPSGLGEPNGVGVNSGARSGAQNPGSRSTASTASTVATIRRPFTSNVSVPSTVPGVLHGKALPIATQHRSWTVGIIVAMSVVALGAVAGFRARRAARRGPRRRRSRLHLGLRLWAAHRRRRHRSPDPTTEVLAQWRDAQSVLEHARLGRRPAETLQEHATRLRSLAGAHWLAPFTPVTPGGPTTPDRTGAPGAATMGTTIDSYGQLAEMAARASYGSVPCSAEEAAAAEALAAAVRSGLVRSSRRGVPVPP